MYFITKNHSEAQDVAAHEGTKVIHGKDRWIVKVSENKPYYSRKMEGELTKEKPKEV